MTPEPLKRGRKWLFADCEYIELRRELRVKGEPVRAEGKPLDVLQCLLERAGELVSTERLLKEVWPDVAVSPQSVVTAINKLRKVVGEKDTVIGNVSGAGYRIMAPVTCVVADGPGPPDVRLVSGDPIPGAKDWIADQPLGVHDPPHVWMAHNRNTKVVHVFKLANDGVQLRALQREVMLSRIFAENTGGVEGGFMRVENSNFEDAPFYIEMEYAGVDLYRFAESDDFKRMPAAERASLAAQIADTVGQAHRLGILHNDLKPGNILVARRTLGKPEWRATVIDFGVASLSAEGRLLAMQMTHYGAFEEGEHRAGGSFLYTAPELRVPGAVPNVATDVYALGVILFQMITGDFLATPTTGWDTRVEDPLLRADIAAAAHIDPEMRTAAAAALAHNLRTLEARRQAEKKRQMEERKAARVRNLRRLAAVLTPVLAIGLSVSLFFYVQSQRALRVANQRNADLQAMNRFVTEDLLSQSNPSLGSASRGQVQQETLVDAIRHASPWIDARFSANPAIAGRLHETIGAALDAQTHWDDAEQEFAKAAQCFRSARGQDSEEAVVAELRRIHSLLRSRESARLQEAERALALQEKVVAHFRQPSAEVRAWEALDVSGSNLLGLKTGEDAVALLNSAIQTARATPGFDPVLLRRMQLRLCPLDLAANKPVEAERAARGYIHEVEAAEGSDTRETFDARMFLQEALHEEGRYSDAIRAGRDNYERFQNALGAGNQLTLAALNMLATDEGELEQYADAVRDELAVHDADVKLPSGAFIAENALIAAAGFECQEGRFDGGLAHARQAAAESGAGGFRLPAFTAAAHFQTAECMLSMAERSKGVPDFETIERELAAVDLHEVSKLLGWQAFEGNYQLAKARLALLRGQRALAAAFAAKAQPFVNQPDTDAYERRKWQEIEDELRGE